jgi:hypothetical protein
MGKTIENHVSRGMRVENNHYSTEDGYDYNYQLSIGDALPSLTLTLMRSIQEYPDELIVNYFKKDTSARYQINVRHSTKDQMWKITLEHNYMPLSNLIYNNLGYLLRAELPLTSTQKFVLQRAYTLAFNLVPIFFDEYPYIHENEPLAYGSSRVKFDYPEKNMTFVGNWHNPEKIVLLSTNHQTKTIKTAAFPAYLPVKDSNLLHQHLDQTYFPLEQFSWQVQQGAV